MHNKKIIAKGIIVATALSNAPVDSLANTIEEYKLINMEDNAKENKMGDSIKNLFAKIVEPIENLISEPKEVIKVNKNIVKSSVLEISLTDGEFVPNLVGNPSGYETVKVITVGSKKLVKADYDNLRLSGIPKIDLSSANSDSIPTGAFTNATHLTEFKFPQGITSIGEKYSNDGAFKNCRGLTGDLIIPEGVTSIGYSAFYGCSGLTGSLIIPEGVISIEYSAFYGCSGLTGDLIIPEGVTSIGESAFRECSGFDGNLVIPNSVTSIGKSAFYRCSGLTGDLIIPEGVTSIGESAFRECSGFDGNLVIPNSVTSIGKSAFYRCSGLTGDLVIPEGLISVGESAFYECSGFNGNLVIPNSLTSIGGSVFYGCSGLTGDLIIPEGVTSIGYSAFYGCSGLTGSLIIPEGVTSIGESAFRGCSGFGGNLVIPEGVISIGESAFRGCSGFGGSLVIPNSVTSIGDSAFSGCSGFNGNLVIPNSLTSIGSSAFYRCSGLTGDLIIPEGVTSIGISAFRGCSGFDGNLVIPNSVTSIEHFAFYECSGLTGNLVIPEGVINISNTAFYGCDNIEKILIKVNSSNIDTNYKKNIIDNLPDSSKTVIDIPYDFDITGTWLETTRKTVVKPVIKNIIDEAESDLIDLKGEKVSLYIPSLYKESNVTVLKDGEPYTLPTKNRDGKHIFTESGVYELTVTTDLGNTSIINFEVEDPQFKNAEETVKNAEQSKKPADIETARDLVNQLPECSIKDQLQDRLDEIFPNLELERKTATANLDIYIKCENMLSMSLDTNSVSFEEYSGAEPIEKLNAVNININSSLPYTLNAYLPNEIQNSDGSNKMDLDILNIRENSEAEYKQFENTTDKLVLKDSYPKGNNINHVIDLKLDSHNAHKADVYKTVIKFEVVQK